MARYESENDEKRRKGRKKEGEKSCARYLTAGWQRLTGRAGDHLLQKQKKKKKQKTRKKKKKRGGGGGEEGGRGRTFTYSFVYALTEPPAHTDREEKMAERGGKGGRGEKKKERAIRFRHRVFWIGADKQEQVRSGRLAGGRPGRKEGKGKEKGGEKVP